MLFLLALNSNLQDKTFFCIKTKTIGEQKLYPFMKGSNVHFHSIRKFTLLRYLHSMESIELNSMCKYMLLRKHTRKVKSSKVLSHQIVVLD